MHIEEVALLAPEQAGECLTLDAPLVLAGRAGMDRAVKLVGLRLSLGDDFVDIGRADGRSARRSESRNRSTAEPPGGTASNW